MHLALMRFKSTVLKTLRLKQRELPHSLMIPYIKTITGLPLLSWKVFTVIVDVLYKHLER